MKKLKIYFIVVILATAFLIDGAMAADFCGKSTKEQCVSISDCSASGCFMNACKLKNQDASSMPAIEDCVWNTCYDHRAFGLECGCLNSQCQWQAKKVKTAVKTSSTDGAVLSNVLVKAKDILSTSTEINCTTNVAGECALETLASKKYEFSGQKDGYNCLPEQCLKTTPGSYDDFSVSLSLSAVAPIIISPISSNTQNAPTTNSLNANNATPASASSESNNPIIADSSSLKNQLPNIIPSANSPTLASTPTTSTNGYLSPKNVSANTIPPENASRPKAYSINPAYLRTEISRIAALIKNLQFQLLSLRFPTPLIKEKITSNLRYGSQGYEVGLLQLWLSKDENIYPAGLITGFFGQLTQLAVKNFQTKYANEILLPRGLIKADGFVENLTIEKLNNIFLETGKRY